MKITRFTLHEVVVPTHEGRTSSPCYGPVNWDKASKFIIEAFTDEGHVGLSETYRETPLESVQADLRGLLDKEIETLCFQELDQSDRSGHGGLVQSDRAQFARLHERTANHWAKIYTQVLVFDLLGKKLGMPMCQLLGGAYREHVAVDYWMAQMTPEDSARVCKQAKAGGYRGVKCKCTLSDDNVARAEAVRDACGADFLMTFDPNHRFYRFGEAVGMLKRLAAVGNIGCVEDPFLPGDDESYVLLRRQGLFPVALHNPLAYGREIIHALREGLVDVMNLSFLPTDTKKAGDICYAAGIPTWHGSGVDLGVLEASYLHECAATKSMTRPSDILGRSIRVHNLVTNPFVVENGFMRVPMGPGLGVELDRDALQKFKVREIVS